MSRNDERDAETTTGLQARGWTVLRFWEHESPSDAAESIAAHVSPHDQSPHSPVTGTR
ncbi:MAG: DUF559 domain-containing protein [Agrococcus casei]|uniref:DUF559 domain-containing protein n=1 Tax=Agrococcus casei TaxID=343512 RepID=UPI003F930EA8